MAAKGGLVVTKDTLTPGLAEFTPKVDRAVAETIEFFREPVASYARSNAPWKDRTGNARSGLHTTTEHVPMIRHAIFLAHSVPYGIWLEIRFEGKYAIIEPTIRSQGLVLMATLRSILRRLH